MGAAPTAAASKLEERKKLRRENIPRNDLVGPDMVVAPWARTNPMGWYGAGQKRWLAPGNSPMMIVCGKSNSKGDYPELCAKFFCLSHYLPFAFQPVRPTASTSWHRGRVTGLHCHL